MPILLQHGAHKSMQGQDISKRSRTLAASALGGTTASFLTASFFVGGGFGFFFLGATFLWLSAMLAESPSCCPSSPPPPPPPGTNEARRDRPTGASSSTSSSPVRCSRSETGCSPFSLVLLIKVLSILTKAQARQASDLSLHLKLNLSFFALDHANHLKQSVSTENIPATMR